VFSASENEFFQEITKKIEVVTRHGGKNSGSLLLERFSNEVKLLNVSFTYLNRSGGKSQLNSECRLIVLIRIAIATKKLTVRSISPGSSENRSQSYFK
jgi:hypothetical protein